MTNAAMELAISRGDADAYMDAIRANPDYSALFQEGISEEARTAIEEGIRADFGADMERARAASGGEFDFSNIGDVLSEIWNNITSGNFDFGQIIQSILGIFNFSADPDVSAFEANVGTGLEAARGIDDPAATEAYAAIVMARDGTPTPS